MFTGKKVHTDWNTTKADTFWGEIATSDHVLQVYENEGVFLDALAGYVGGGINAGDCCIVIATDEHVEALNNRLADYGIQVKALKADQRYITLNAQETLDKFMRNGHPDEELFMKTVGELADIAKCKGRKIRAFGEMVVLLLAEGNKQATMELENLWNKFCAQETLCLFCAYPKYLFPENNGNTIVDVCCTHSKLIEGSQKQLTEVHYKDLVNVQHKPDHVNIGNFPLETSVN